MPNLVTLYRNLPRPGRAEGQLVFSATPDPIWGSHRLAKAPDDSPFLLIATRPEGQVPPPLRLRHLAVHHRAKCTILGPRGTATEETYTLVGCVEAEPAIRDYFLGSFERLLPLLGEEPAAANVNDMLVNLVELFRLLEEPARCSIQGLWAELVVIAEASDGPRLLRAWHATPTDLYDFNEGGDRLEVKSSSGSRRVHHFRLEQIRPLDMGRVFVASVLVRPAGAGDSVPELAERIRRRLSDSILEQKLFRVIAESLGEDWPRAAQARFDLRAARDSIAIYEAAAIPAVDSPASTAVTEIRFVVDISAVTPALPSSLGPLARAAGPVPLNLEKHSKGLPT
jgi:putative PD-(D/E)XK family protein DUF4420